MMSESLSTREAYGKALAELGKKHEFLVLDADLAKATQTVVFKKNFPERFFDMGISEGDMMTTAAGLATCGKTVFASTFAMFASGRAYEQIRNSIAYPGLHVVIGATHGGVLIGEDGASHQCIEDISLMRTIPNMTVVVPCDERSVFEAVKLSLSYKGPIYLRMGRTSSPAVYTEDIEFEIGRGNVLKDGTDLTIIAIGDMVYEALEAAKILGQTGVSVAVIDMHTVKPIDKDLVVEFAEKTKKIITAEDHNIVGGLGSAVAELVAETGCAKLKRIGLNDCFGMSGSRAELQKKFGLNAQHIVDTYRKMSLGRDL